MQYFLEGGPVMYFILLAAFLVGGWEMLGMALAVGGRFVPAVRLFAKIAASLGLVATVAPVLLGVIGWQLGLVQVANAVQHASPEMKQQLQDAGEAIAIVPMWFGLGTTAVLVPLALFVFVVAMLPAKAAEEGRDA